MKLLKEFSLKLTLKKWVNLTKQYYLKQRPKVLDKIRMKLSKQRDNG